jgi:hypothetical protein
MVVAVPRLPTFPVAVNIGKGAIRSKKASVQPSVQLVPMGLVCSNSDTVTVNAKKKAKNVPLDGVAPASILSLDIRTFISDAIALNEQLAISQSVKQCIKRINGGVLQLTLFDFIDGQLWQPTPLLQSLVLHSTERFLAWRKFFVDIESAATRGQSELSKHSVELHKFSFSLLVSQSEHGCTEQVGYIVLEVLCNHSV